MKRIYARNNNIEYKMIQIYGNPYVHFICKTRNDGIIINYLYIDKNYRSWKYK